MNDESGSLNYSSDLASYIIKQREIGHNVWNFEDISAAESIS